MYLGIPKMVVRIFQYIVWESLFSLQWVNSKVVLFMSPTSNKVEGHIGLGLSVRLFVYLYGRANDRILVGYAYVG